MPCQILENRSVLIISGDDASSFLQNLVTANIENLVPKTLTPCALLTPQGKVAFDFLIATTDPNSFIIDISSDLLDEFKKRLFLYRLRAAVTIEEQTSTRIVVSWHNDKFKSQTSYKDLRFPEEQNVIRVYDLTDDIQPQQTFDEIRIENGVAESGSDFEPGSLFPHDIGFDLNGGIDFKKGCYVGQEVVSRMQHRSTARRRVAILKTSENFDQNDNEVILDGKTIGQIGTKIDNHALAILRIDRLIKGQNNDAYPTVNGKNIEVSFPTWLKPAIEQIYLSETS